MSLTVRRDLAVATLEHLAQQLGYTHPSEVCLILKRVLFLVHCPKRFLSNSEKSTVYGTPN